MSISWAEDAAVVTNTEGSTVSRESSYRHYIVPPRKLFVLNPLRLHRVRAGAADLVFLVALEVAFEPFDMGVGLEGEGA
jgi:hypothetical protein